jgi:hypothetical protein
MAFQEQPQMNMMQLLPTLLSLAERQKQRQEEEDKYYAEYPARQLQQKLAEAQLLQHQNLQKDRLANTEATGQLAEIEQGMMDLSRQPVSPQIQQEIQNDPGTILPGGGGPATPLYGGPLQSRASRMQMDIDNKMQELATKRRGVMMRNPGAFKDMMSQEQLGQALGFGMERQTNPLQNVKDINSLYHQSIGNNGEVLYLANPGIAQMAGLPPVINAGTFDALKKASDESKTASELKNLQSRFVAAKKAGEAFPEEDYIALQKLAPASEHPRLREEYVRHQNEVGAATPEQEEELKYITAKKDYALGDTHNVTVDNGDGTSTTMVYKKLDWAQKGKDAKPIASFSGKAKPVEESVKADIQKRYLESNMLVKNLKQVEAYVKPEYLTWTNRAENEIKNNLIKANMSDKQASEEVRQFQMFKKTVLRATNAYRRLVTGQAASVEELKRIEDSFLSGRMSYPEFMASLDTLYAEAANNQSVFSDFTKHGISKPETRSGETDAAQRVIDMFKGGAK